MRIVRVFGTLALVTAIAGPAAARRAYREPNPAPQKANTTLWQQVLKPHADEVAQLLWEARKLRDEYAPQYYEPHQQPQRKQVLADAMQRFQRAHELDPDDADITLELANCAFDVGDYQQAVAGYLEYRDRKPEDKQYYYVTYNMAEAYLRQRLFEEAAAVLETGVSDAQGWPPLDKARTLDLLGYVYMAQNRLDDAIDVYSRAASIQAYGASSDWMALASLAVAYDRDEQLGRAGEMLDQLKQLDPNFTFLYQQYPVPAYSNPSQRYYIPYSPASDKHYWIAMAYEAQDHLPEAAVEWRAYIESSEPTYKRRAEAHLKDVKTRLIARAKAAKEAAAKEAADKKKNGKKLTPAGKPVKPAVTPARRNPKRRTNTP